MPTSAPPERSYPDAEPEGQGLAVLSESLYLANLLLLPGLAFLVLAVLFLRRRRTLPPLAAAHLAQAFFASLWAGMLLLVVNLSIVVLGGCQGPWVWTVVLVYFTVCHSFLVLLGMFGLAKAMSGQCFRFPLVGRDLPRECRKWERP